MIKTIVDTELPLDERLLVRKNVIKNGKGRKRFCVVTGTHGDELEGQMVCYEVARLIQANIERLDGTVEIWPALNPLGIDTLQRGVPNFDLDMNRIFPGNEHGTMAEHTAYRICQDLKGADMVLDIHSSNLYLREAPQVRINVLNEDTLVPQAQHLGVDFIWVHDAATVLEATLAHSLNSTGTPCLVVEMGVVQRINNRMCHRLVDGIFNLMRQMGMWKDEPAAYNLHRVQGRPSDLPERSLFRRLPYRPAHRQDCAEGAEHRPDCRPSDGPGTQSGHLARRRIPLHHTRLPHCVRGIAHGPHLPVQRGRAQRRTGRQRYRAAGTMIRP